METIVRREKPGDEPVIHELVRSAFPTDQEALLNPTGTCALCAEVCEP